MSKITDIFKAETTLKRNIPLFLAKIPAGFPSPADDYLDKKLDLNEFLIRKPNATYLLTVKGDSMIEAGIKSGSILIVDCSIEPSHNNIVVASINGELTVKRFIKQGKKVFLKAENPNFKPIELSEDSEIEIFGVVTANINSHYDSSH